MDWKALVLGFDMMYFRQKRMHYRMRYSIFCNKVPLLQFFCSHHMSRNYYILVLCMPPHCLYQSLTPRHTLNQIPTHLQPYLVPFHLYPFPQLQHPCRCSLILSQPFFKMIPQVLNGIKIWRLSLPWKNLESMVFKPSGGLLALILWVIILLKDDDGGVFAIKSKAFLKLIFQDFGIKLPILPSINLPCIPNTIPQHTVRMH